MPKPYTPLTAAALGAACASLLGGCAPAGSESGAGADGALTVTAGNAGQLAGAALAVSAIADSLPGTRHFNSLSPVLLDCRPGSVSITPSGGGADMDVITSPSGNALPLPPPSETVLEYDACLEEGYTKTGFASGRVLGQGGSHRVRWNNLRLEHPLMESASLVGVAIYEDFGDRYYQRIEGLTVTFAGSAFYTEGALDSFSFPRAVRYDLIMRITDTGGASGSVQLATTERLGGARNTHFDSGVLRIAGAGASAVDVIPQGSGVYSLEIDADGDGVTDDTRTLALP